MSFLSVQHCTADVIPSHQNLQQMLARARLALDAQAMALRAVIQLRTSYDAALSEYRRYSEEAFEATSALAELAFDQALRDHVMSAMSAETQSAPASVPSPAPLTARAIRTPPRDVEMQPGEAR